MSRKLFRHCIQFGEEKQLVRTKKKKIEKGIVEVL